MNGATFTCSRRQFLQWAGGILSLYGLGHHLAVEWAWAAPSAADPFIKLPALRPDEWQTIGLFANHIFPKTATAPSAVQAGVLTYMNRRLLGKLPGWRPGPATPPARRPPGETGLIARYRRVIARLDVLAQEAHQKAFSALSAAEQAAIVALLANGNASETGDGADRSLFNLVRRHAIEGYFSDPVHGGNKNYSAWEAIHHTCHMNYPKPHKCDPAS